MAYEPRRTIRVSQVLDQADDAEVRPLPIGAARDMAAAYRAMNSGIAAKAEEEATAEQLAALASKVSSDHVPYGDFAVLRPHGLRLNRAMKFVAKVWIPSEGGFMTRELPGPPDFLEWKRSWRVYRYALMVLRVATAPKLERYMEKVEELHNLYGELGGEDMWWVLCSAEARMRSERFEHIRRELEQERANLKAEGRVHAARLNPDMPWDAVFLAAAEDTAYWDSRVKDVAMLYKANLKPRHRLTDEGHHVPIPGQAGLGTKANRDKPDPPRKTNNPGGGRGKGAGKPGKPSKPGEGKRANRNARRREEEAAKAAAEQAAKDAKRNEANKGKGRSGQICYKWTKDTTGCAVGGCPDGRSHPPCPKCSKAHPWQQACPQ